MERKRKITIETNDKMVGEQAILICDMVYDLLEEKGVDYYDSCSLKNIILNVSVKELLDKGVFKTKKSIRFEIFYCHPLTKGKEKELQICIFWSNENVGQLFVKELSGVFGGADKYMSIYLPLQPTMPTTFEELFAHAIIRAIQNCFKLLDQKSCEMAQGIANHQKRLEAANEDISFEMSLIGPDNYCSIFSSD